MYQQEILNKFGRELTYVEIRQMMWVFRNQQYVSTNIRDILTVIRDYSNPSIVNKATLAYKNLYKLEECFEDDNWQRRYMRNIIKEIKRHGEHKTIEIWYRPHEPCYSTPNSIWISNNYVQFPKPPRKQARRIWQQVYSGTYLDENENIDEQLLIRLKDKMRSIQDCYNSFNHNSHYEEYLARIGHTQPLAF